MIRLSVLVAIALVFGACTEALGHLPSFVADRPATEADCGPNQPVYLPARQAPEERVDESFLALKCMLTEIRNTRSAELQFILLGTEGERYDAYLQSHADGTLNYYRETVDGWIGHEGCRGIEWPEPGIPRVGACATQYP